MDYSIAADLPKGASLKIILKGGVWYYRVSPDGPVNWDVSQYNFSQKSQIFTSIETGTSCDISIHFGFVNEQEDLQIEYYENGSSSPTKIKNLTII